jgi:AcrR family transcriptional regulator
VTNHNEAVMVPSRQTADERRTAVLAAAISEFARSGYAGTSTEAVASRAGISQPYLFRLFGTKKNLFVATIDLVSDRIIGELTRASEGLEGDQAKEAMGGAYLELMQDPDLLQVQLHGFAAAPADPDIAASCRRTFDALQAVFFERTHGTEEDLQYFFAMGMLINVMAAIDLLSVPEPWAQNLCMVPDKANSIQLASQLLDAHRRAAEASDQEVSA